MSMEQKLAQPFHFTVKTYAQRKDGQVPFTVECSVHLSADQVDSIGQENDPVKVGIEKMQKLYTDMGYVEATKANPPPPSKSSYE